MLSSRPTHLQLNRQILCSGLALVLLLSAVAIQAQQPTSQVVTFAGTIPGQPDGPVAVRFRIYPVITGGTILFEETQTVTVAAEKFTVRIGDATVGGIPALVFRNNPTNPSAFVAFALDVTPDVEIGSRTAITSAGFTHFASAIADEAVTTSTIVDLAVTTPKIADGAVTGPKLAPNSVDSTKIVDGAVGAVAVNSGQVQLRVSGICNPGSAIRQVDLGGTVVCELTGGGGGIGGSGTPNQIAKFTAATTIGNSAIWEVGGKVGIGVPAPIAELDIFGDVNLTNSTGVTGNILKGGTLFIHNFGANNFFSGVGAGNLTLNPDPTLGATENTGVGAGALSSLSTGSLNTAIGRSALRSNTTGSFNTASGFSALDSNNTGSNNTAIGISALRSNTTGTLNTAIGDSALRNNISGSFNTAVGDSAGLFNTGSVNSFFGDLAGKNNTTGHHNSFFGGSTGWLNTTGFENAFFGWGAGGDNTEGADNSFFGSSAGVNNTTGFENAFFGRGAGRGNTTGFNNAFFGDNAGFTNVNGTNNTAIGLGADVGDVALTNATAIGAGARVLTSNTIQLGNNQVTKVVTHGVVTAGGFNGLCVFSTPAQGLPLFCDQDVAEAFATLEATEPGDLVVLVNQSSSIPTVRKSTRPYEGLLLGAVSTSPGLVFDMGETRLAGDNSQLITSKKTVIGLVGRVPVKVSLENGPIAVGDPITSSSTKGVAMKATRAGQIIGYALGKADEKGKVLVHLQPGYYIPPQQLALLNEINQIDKLKAQVSELRSLLQTVLAQRAEGSVRDVAKSQVYDKARLIKAGEENQEPQ